MTRFKAILVLLICGVLISGCIILVYSENYRTMSFSDMVDASVLIYDEYGHGSGVFIADNVILTAGHCLEHEDSVSIELNNGTALESSDFYIDEKEDIGFIFVDADELHIATLSAIPGDVGDTVYLVGAPYDMSLKFTITKGILSHLDRDRYGYEDLLQTDAEGARGSSGGPLYDSNGNVIGICVSGVNPGGGVTFCESGKSILEAYERAKEYR